MPSDGGSYKAIEQSFAQKNEEHRAVAPGQMTELQARGREMVCKDKQELAALNAPMLMPQGLLCFKKQ